MPQGDADSLQPDSPDTLAAGTILGDYEIVGGLGKGGMAVVYEARHRLLNKRVAVKVLHSASRKADLSRRFLREAENAARLSHPHVVDVSHVGTAHGLPYLVMEYLEGEDLGAYLKRMGKLEIEATADLLVPVACAIAAAHEGGVVHRDLKPQNIFLCKARGGGPTIPKVVDFGVSKLLDSQSLALTDTDAILGTPFYMSPEQAMEAKHVDARTDQFSLGVILYECVTGVRPFAGDSLFSVLTAIVHLRQQAPSSLSDSMDPDFEALVERALQKKPDERFSSMQALGRELLRFASLRVQVSASSELGSELGAQPATGRTPSAPAAAPSEGRGQQPTRVLSSVPVTTGPKPAGEGARAGAKLPRWGAYAAAALVCGGSLTWLLTRDDGSHSGPPKLPRATHESPPPMPAPAASGSSDWDTQKPGAPPPAVTLETASVEVEPAAAQLSLDGVYLGTGRASFRMPSDGRTHRLHVSADGYAPLELTLDQTPPPPKLVLTRLAPAPREERREQREIGVQGAHERGVTSETRPRDAVSARPTPSSPRAEAEAAPGAAPSPAPTLEPKPAPAAPKSTEFQAFPSARGGKRPVRPLDQHDPWK
jgi:eukaryotic-like serine/threonine-protein kinase